MKRIAVAALLLAAGWSCSEAEPERTPLQRGLAMFEAPANQLGEAVIVELRAASEKTYQQYLQESGCSNEVELGRKIGKEVLARFAEAFKLSEEEEKKFKSGSFDDEANSRKLKATVQLYLDTKTEVPKACVTALKKVDSGEWKKGIHLEMTVRMLQGQWKNHGH